MSLPQLDFYVLAGNCADAALSRDRDVIKGRFGVSRPKRYWQLVAKFANWSTDERHIVRFVRRFGPLTVPYGVRGRTFSIRLEEWRDFQRSFRLAWEKWKGIGRGHPVTWSDLKEETVFHDGKQPKIQFKTVGRYLTFALHVLPPERVKLCGRPDCPHPYFIAQHLKERYCCEGCANWADKQVKRRWWNETGANQRQLKSGRSIRRRGQ
jgi:hypothetical protein